MDRSIRKNVRILCANIINTISFFCSMNPKTFFADEVGTDEGSGSESDDSASNETKDEKKQKQKQQQSERDGGEIYFTEFEMKTTSVTDTNRTSNRIYSEHSANAATFTVIVSYSASSLMLILPFVRSIAFTDTIRVIH